LPFFMNFELPCVHVAPKKGPPFLDTRARMRREIPEKNRTVNLPVAPLDLLRPEGA